MSTLPKKLKALAFREAGVSSFATRFLLTLQM